MCFANRTSTGSVQTTFQDKRAESPNQVQLCERMSDHTAASIPGRGAGKGKASPGDTELEQSHSHLWDASNPMRKEQLQHETQGCCMGLGVNWGKDKKLRLENGRGEDGEF